MSEEENTIQKEQKNESVMKVYGYTPLIKTLLQGAVVTESIYLISDYWSSYLKAAGNFATNNMNMFNTTILPQISYFYQSIVNNPITSAIVTTGAIIGYNLTSATKKINYGEVEKTGYFFGEKNIEKIFDFSKLLTVPTVIIAGLYSTISGTVQSWPMFNAQFFKNTPNVLSNYSALFTTIAIGAVIYSSKPLITNLTNLSRGVYEKAVMVKELFKDVKNAFKGEKIESLRVEEEKVEKEKSVIKNKSEQVKFFERLIKIKGKFSVDSPKKNKN